eukprot:1289540-Rhodomonas_salina.1
MAQQNGVTSSTSESLSTRVWLRVANTAQVPLHCQAAVYGTALKVQNTQYKKNSSWSGTVGTLSANSTALSVIKTSTSYPGSENTGKAPSVPGYPRASAKLNSNTITISNTNTSRSQRAGQPLSNQVQA